MKTRETGAVTLIASLILVIGMFSLTGFGTRHAIEEQSSSASDRRTKEAFEAAEAGLEKGIAYLQANSATIVVDNNGDGFIDSYSDPAINNASLINGSKFSVSYSNATPGNLNVLDVTSVGNSVDGTVTRTVRITVVRQPIFSSAVSGSLVAKNAVTLSGNVGITNTFTNPTIWSGGAISLSGAAGTSGLNGASSNKNAISSDVIQNDSALAGMSSQQFFSNFFSVPASVVRNNANQILTNPGSINSLDGVTGQTIWVDQSSGSATLNSNVTIGSAQSPVVLIINGDFKMNGNTTIYGVVYTTGDWINSGGGTATIVGAAIVNGQLQSTGTPNVNYDPSIVGKIQSNLVTYAKVPGSWRDI